MDWTIKKVVIGTAIVLILLLVLCWPTQAQTPKTVTFGQLYTTSGETDLAFTITGRTDMYYDSTRNFTSYIRTGYMKTFNSTDTNEVQALIIQNILEKELWQFSRNASWCAAFKVGSMIKIKTGEDDVTGTVGFETGVHWSDIAITSIGVDYYPRNGQKDRTYVYILFNIFP